MTTLRGDKMSMLIHTYLHKPLRIEVTKYNYRVDSPFYFWPYVCFVDLQEKSMVTHNTECPYRDQVSLNNTNAKLNSPPLPGSHAVETSKFFPSSVIGDPSIT